MKSIDYANKLIANRYAVSHLLGQGGMGAVYAADDLLLSRRVAIKFMNGLSDQSIARFKREYKLLAKVNGPNIVQIFERGQTDDGIPFIVMEYVNGRTLEQALSDPSDRLETEEIITIAAQICTALSNLHTLGLVHRDLNPSNIMLTNDQRTIEAKLMDFGAVHETNIALTATNELLGSPAYMSPEHLTPKLLDARSDIFSLGCVLYRCVAGTPPFEADSALQTLIKMRTGAKADLNSAVPPFLRNTIDRCIRPIPSDRFQSAEDLHKALTERKCDQPESAPLTRARSRKPLLMALIGVAIIGTSAFIFMRPPAGGNPSSQAKAELDVLANQSDWTKFDELASKTITPTNQNAFSETWESFDKVAHHYHETGDYEKAIKYSDLALRNCNKISRKPFLELSGIDIRFCSNKSDLQWDKNAYLWLSVNENKVQSSLQSLLRLKELRARLSQRLNLNPQLVKSNFENVLQYAVEKDWDEGTTLPLRQDYARFLVNQRDPARKKVIEDIKTTTLDQLKNNSYVSWMFVTATLNLEFEEASNTEANKLIAEFEPYAPKDITDRCSFWCDMYRLSLKTDKPRVNFTDNAYAHIGNLAPAQQCDVLLLMALAHPERRMEFTQIADKTATIHQIAPHCRAAVHTNLAQAYALRKDYQTAVKYLDQAIQEYLADKEPQKRTTLSPTRENHLRGLQETRQLWFEKAKSGAKSPG
ncbi:MAG: protein kinase [Candidatus Obscuribacterales bacterium]|nr:protein kinase [Candidatus Obscuribacterales bacterium]